jgi:hypothetical protein
MNVTADHVTALRALVTGDDDAFERLTGSAGPAWMDALAHLLTGVFLAATRYRFGSEASQPDIIRFVAQSRVRHGADEAGFSPSLAEGLMGAALGISPVLAGHSEDENAAAQIVLLKDLAGEISYLDFESLLETARTELNKLDLHPGGVGNA